MKLKKEITESDHNHLCRERDMILLLTGKTPNEVLGTFTWKELRHLHASMLFFQFI